MAPQLRQLPRPSHERHPHQPFQRLQQPGQLQLPPDGRGIRETGHPGHE
ncbi:hypothetical protein [Streptomyces sp. CC228A]|nr:hypothetical protein [Streptomyces sp. CC228A]